MKRELTAFEQGVRAGFCASSYDPDSHPYVMCAFTEALIAEWKRGYDEACKIRARWDSSVASGIEFDKDHKPTTIYPYALARYGCERKALEARQP